VDAEFAGVVVGGCDDAASLRGPADDYRLANQRRVVPHLDRGIESVHVDVEDHSSAGTFCEDGKDVGLFPTWIGPVADGFHPAGQFPSQLLQHRSEARIVAAIGKFKRVILLVEKELFIRIAEDELPAVAPCHTVALARRAAYT